MRLRGVSICTLNPTCGFRRVRAMQRIEALLRLPLRLKPTQVDSLMVVLDTIDEPQSIVDEL